MKESKSINEKHVFVHVLNINLCFFLVQILSLVVTHFFVALISILTIILNRLAFQLLSRQRQHVLSSWMLMLITTGATATTTASTDDDAVLNILGEVIFPAPEQI